MNKFLSLFSFIIAFVSSFVKNIFNYKKNKKQSIKNKAIIKNEIEKIAKNAESTDKDIKNKAIDDMRKLISD